MTVTQTELGTPALSCDAFQCNKIVVDDVVANATITARSNGWYLGTLQFCDRHYSLSTLPNPTLSNDTLKANAAAALAASNFTLANTIRTELRARGARDELPPASGSGGASTPTVFNEVGVFQPSTPYQAYDIGTYNGARVVLKTGITTGVAPVFISAANYWQMSSFQVLDAQSFGVSMDNNQATATNNQAFLQSVLDSANFLNANGVGALVKVPRGNGYFTGDLDVRSGVWVQGSGPMGTWMQLIDGANKNMFKPHTSTGAANPNAFFWQISDMTIDCKGTLQGTKITDGSITASSTTITSVARPWVDNEYVRGSGIPPETKIVPGTQAGAGPFTATMTAPAQQTIAAAGTFIMSLTLLSAIRCTMNPLTSAQTGDFAFDPSGRMCRLHIRNPLDYGILIEGRSSNLITNVKVSNSYGCAFKTSFDSRLEGVESDFAAWHGWVVAGSSQTCTGSKFFNGGQNKLTTAAAVNDGHGIHSDDGRGEISIAGVDCQQNSGSSIYIKNGTNWQVSGTSADAGYASAGGSALSTGYHVELDNTVGCNIMVAGKTQQTGRCYRIVNGSDKNTLILSHGLDGAGAVGAAASADTVNASNSIRVNGTVVAEPGTTSGVVMGVYVRKTVTTPTMILPMMSSLSATALATPTVNLLYAMRYTLPRAGMKVYWGCVRPTVLATAASVVRMGIYIPVDGSQNDVPTLLGELTALEANVPMDLTAGGGAANAVRQTTILAAPLTVPGLEFFGVICVQTNNTTLSLQAITGGAFGASGNNPVPVCAIQAGSGVSGALPATILTTNAAGPLTGFGTAPSFGVAVMD